MSVNGLWTYQLQAQRQSARTYPSKRKAMVYATYTYNVINNPAGRSYL